MPPSLTRRRLFLTSGALLGTGIAAPELLTACSRTEAGSGAGRRRRTAGEPTALVVPKGNPKGLTDLKSCAAVEVLEPFVPVVDGVAQHSPGGAVFRPGATGLRDAFHQELAKITADPARYVRLIGKYGFTAREMPPRTLCPA